MAGWRGGGTVGLGGLQSKLGIRCAPQQPEPRPPPSSNWGNPTPPTHPLHPPTHRRQVPVVVDSAQVVEHLERTHERLGRGGVHEVEVHLRFGRLGGG